ncbi:sugar ABC transporter substrate-binding protein [Amycolatopsis acidiphila]|uniref:Sugar ABC transporter substrate-binding protein n=1 Tax=Amycolatopsis acidiphila TaxID=715473 RepID=A0A557ZSJ8_9PSEU|nr:sugar ABC transporter substrate-binding protein [Amycolatopsis acidiphila]TVT14985.1 sugar ABC transporter substrate-binding protein [Amycolatopsis acidiphila]UIJ62919.1 sugar ABC transporter substrate-binding protein [Amycolatopsis acidiphila]GHG65056.1 D-ribose ABC transporter substrate-binding protein [Amycolatopsis acidiphila]
MKTSLRLAAITGVAALTVSLAACSRPSTDAATATSAAPADKTLNIGFFGFAKANSFAQATWAGIQEYAAAHNANATFLDSNFDGPTQVNQLQDAVTSKRYDVVIVQANDGTAIVSAVKQAVAAGITVVVEFTPVGGDYSTTNPQVPGTVSIVDAPTVNGEGMATLGLGACKEAGATPCKVAFLQGFANYPLDTARTDAAVDALKAGGADVVANVVGGYTQDSGRAAFQNVLQAHPDVNVVIGSSQAVEGAAPLAAGKNIKFVGNGGSKQAYEAVQSGAWYGVYVVPEKAEGAKAAELGLGKARGQQVPVATDARTLTPFQGLGTRQTLQGQTSDYAD